MKKFILIALLAILSLTAISVKAQSDCIGITVYRVDTTLTLTNGFVVSELYYVSTQQYTGKLRCKMFSMDVSAFPDTNAIKRRLTPVVALDTAGIPFSGVSSYHLSNEQIVKLNFATGEYNEVFMQIIAAKLGILADKITVLQIQE